MERKNEIPNNETIKEIMCDYKITGFALGKDKFTEIMDEIETREAKEEEPFTAVFCGIKIVKSDLLPPDAMIPMFEKSLEFNIEDFDFTKTGMKLRYKLQMPTDQYKQTNSNFFGDISVT